ncbi:GDYXXLXY domain-containing protein [Rhizobacter sp. AJA081-3]|uniref:GDYXXLXY domain-containing protein n=1 Tax=Rhizobacter sp. AJA081-3 TaxID=2753607 RepID=UPI001ADF9D08|nr:GDYXXLXY domain-containing protein [Rhizobacter sp. AJA081-3]QTN25283.1 GDYXXLXY domain-containing protein [Rhizobacter sp. AJA081-3]
MSRHPLDAVLHAGISEGLLPAGATAPTDNDRPWPVVLLTALGAWLATLPLLGVVGMLLGDLISRSAGPYFIGTLMLAGAVVVLRSRSVPLFIEQLAVPALLVGGGSLGFGLFRDLHHTTGAAVLCLVSLGVALLVRGPWLRVLLGAAAAILFVVAGSPSRWRFDGDFALDRFWLSWHLAAAVWLLALWLQRQLQGDAARARAAAALESIAAGWLLATLAGLAWWSGMTFLVGGSLGGGFVGEVARELGRRAPAAWSMGIRQALSAVLALAGMGWAVRGWPGLGRPAYAGVGAVLVALAWFMPALGAVLLALAVCATSARWRLATAAGVAAAWIVGAFYYQLDWPLATKAAVLVGAGAVLGALGWWAGTAHRAGQATPAAPENRGGASARWGIAASVVAVLAVANVGIWQKEDLIAHGRPVYVELAPVDPRSLMQGDFMRLNFRMPGEVQSRLDGLTSSQRPRMIGRRDERGVATLVRLDDGTALATEEFRFELTPKDGRWILVSDAWFFREGEAQRWQPAKYGEFRVDANGKALLVGLRGPNLEAL